MLINDRELGGGQIACNSGLRCTRCISTVAESNFSRGHVPAFHVVGYHGLQFKFIDIKDCLVTGLGKLFGKTVCKIESRDTLAIERRDLPNDLVPHMVLKNDGLVAALV